jgi:hypothetical protein
MVLCLAVASWIGCAPAPDELEGDEAALSSDCHTDRVVQCHESANDCSYAAKRCDPVPRALDRVSRTPEFPLDGGGHAVEDSLGNVVGRTAPGVTTVHLNWGQRRVLHGTSKVLAWAVHTDAGTVTGWINESAIARDLSWMPDVEGRDPGGSYSTWHVVQSNDAPYRDRTGASLKVVASCGGGMNATDYLVRNGRVNLIYNLPGYKNPPLGSGTIDVYPVAARPLFRRAQAQHSLSRPLYDCASGTPVRTSKELRFLYGHIVGAASRPGWIAEPAIAPGD